MPSSFRVHFVVLAACVLVCCRLAMAETIVVAPCGSTPVTTVGSHSGLVEITVSGTMVNTPGNPDDDAFYNLVPNDYSMTVGPNPEWLRFAHQSQANSTCFPGALPVSGSLAGPYPTFNPGHTYDVLVELGPGPEQLIFGIADCGCVDNSGQFTLSIDAATTTTTTTSTTTTTTTTVTPTTTTTLPTDADGDGVPDAAEQCECLGTASGSPVTALGCSIDQACPCAAPLGRASWRNHGEYVRCVKSASRELEQQGAMTRTDAVAVGRAAARSDCGR